MYPMIACIGNCFAGPSAISHAFLSFKISVSCVVGDLRADICDFYRKSAGPTPDQVYLTCLPESAFDPEKPGGSGICPAFLGFGGKPLCRSCVHWGTLGANAGDFLSDIFWSENLRYVG